MSHTTSHEASDNKGPVRLPTGEFITAGVIRFDPSGIYIHENSNHRNRGIERININSNGFLELFYERSPIVSLGVWADETISGYKGILVGGSGGNGYADLRFYDTKIGRRLNLLNESDYDRLAHSNANIWVNILQDGNTYS